MLVTNNSQAECIYTRRWTPRPISSSGKSARPQSGSSITSNGDNVPAARKALSKEDDAKLIFGLVFSLRNMVQKLGGEDNRCANELQLASHAHY